MGGGERKGGQYPWGPGSGPCILNLLATFRFGLRRNIDATSLRGSSVTTPVRGPKMPYAF